MKRVPVRLAMAAGAMGLVLCSGGAHATLIVSGDTVIDTDTQLIWLRDANLAMTSGFDADGLMNWGISASWVSGLTVGGYTDWRLPEVIDFGNDGCTVTPVEVPDYYQGGPNADCGFNTNPDLSELAYLFHESLGNLSARDTNGFPKCSSSPPHCLVNTEPFVNVQDFVYWTGTEHLGMFGGFWDFDTRFGIQDRSHPLIARGRYAWAVRTCIADECRVSVSVPEPGTAALLALGLAGLAARLRRRTAPR